MALSLQGLTDPEVRDFTGISKWSLKRLRSTYQDTVEFRANLVGLVRSKFLCDHVKCQPDIAPSRRARTITNDLAHSPKGRLYHADVTAIDVSPERPPVTRFIPKRTNACPPARITNQQPCHDVPHGHSPCPSPSSSTGATAGQAHSTRTTRMAQRLRMCSASTSAGGRSNGGVHVASVKSTNAVWIQLCIHIHKKNPAWFPEYPFNLSPML
ncbi:hypothetical protein EDB85DRAFT_1900401 [Lactarius pseudohatsudake]|nr:hypothetical protein EDB85DRAFT_1900401 [Lactarius pseudohatsudake]